MGECRFNLYLLMYTRERCKDSLIKVIVRMRCKNELTCIKEGCEGMYATRRIKYMKALMRYDFLN